jgi:hypothetical protein
MFTRVMSPLHTHAYTRLHAQVPPISTAKGPDSMIGLVVGFTLGVSTSPPLPPASLSHSICLIFPSVSSLLPPFSLSRSLFLFLSTLSDPSLSRSLARAHTHTHTGGGDDRPLDFSPRARGRGGGRNGCSSGSRCHRGLSPGSRRHGGCCADVC